MQSTCAHAPMERTHNQSSPTVLIIEIGKQRLVNVRFTPKSDIRQRIEHVCLVPEADIAGYASSPMRPPPSKLIKICRKDELRRR